MGTILETNGCQVLTVETGSQGKLIFFSHRPDLIMLNPVFPDMDDLELIKTVQKSSAGPAFLRLNALQIYPAGQTTQPADCTSLRRARYRLTFHKY